jgi:hypothetical protein
MGYEVKYHYHDKTESGYDTDDVKIFTKRVGKSFEDTSLGAVASAIIRQLARRDIWVVNVEIVEFVKKEISFRESKGGIVIKNKKFNFDSISQSIVEDEDVEDVEDVDDVDDVDEGTVDTPAVPLPVKPPVVESLGRPLRKESFNPEVPGLAQECQRRGYAFTLGKLYDIYKETPDFRGLMHGMVYTVLDDNGKKREMNDKHFASDAVLKGFENPATPRSAGGTGLNWQGTVSSDMPDLRG